MSQNNGTPSNFMGAPMSGAASMPKLPVPANGDHNIGYRIEIAATVTCVAAAVVVMLRFHARIKYARVGWDDYFMLGALIQAIVATIIDFVATDWGLGRHLYYLNPEQRVKQQYYSLLAQVFCIHALTFCKISIALTYVRILKGSFNRWLKHICHVLSISVLIVNTMVIIVFYAQCIPNEKSWNPALPGTCYDRRFLMGFVLLQGSFSAFTDLALCIIPLFLLKDLQVGRKSKAILMTIIALGLITAIFGIIRTVESSQGFKVKIPDNSYTSISGLVWAGMERNLAILLGSIPQCRPLVVPVSNFTKATWSRVTGKSFASSDGSSKGQQYVMHETIGGSNRTPAMSNDLSMDSKKTKRSTVTSSSSQEDIFPDYHGRSNVPMV